MTSPYDQEVFFNKYSQMLRSLKGLQGAGEWSALSRLLPDFKNKDVLDLGCGFGWHCIYAAEKGAHCVVGVDASEKMLQQARKKTNTNVIRYIKADIEKISFPKASFDVVISSLAFHYVDSFKNVCQTVFDVLRQQGDFVFSVEHPVFTAQGKQDWMYSETGEKLCWPVDSYFYEGKRNTCFLGERIEKYHRTLTTYINTVINTGFELIQVVEPQPDPDFLKNYPDMAEELRRPMMLLIAARKKV